MPTYPIHHEPSVALLKRVDIALSDDFKVSELSIVQWGRSRWSAQFRLGEVGKDYDVEFTIGGAEPSREAIEDRLIKFLSEK